ncbi:MAG: hypothetical protein KAH00_00470 [Cocleimonas sp.]|nr:hypothetical protein [Cocleimonas sp.]
MRISNSKEETQIESIFTAPDPRFISTLLLFSKGFPWDKLLQFFQSKNLVFCPAEDQIFLLRLLALQEFLCLDDEALLKWAKHQFQLTSFLHRGYKVNIPSPELLAHFRTTLDEVGILASFRKQCQKIIMMHDEKYKEKNNHQRIPEASNWGSQRIIGVNIEECQSEKDAKWIACPVCKSQNVNKVLAPHWVGITEEDWCRCRFCGNKFKI